MEIGATSFSGAAQQQQFNVRNTQSDYAEQMRVREPASSSGEVKTSNLDAPQAQAAQRQESNDQSARAEASKVFVNAQGQKTGTIISVTA